MFTGYARVSTDEQNLHLQHDELKKAGYEKFYEDKITGSKIGLNYRNGANAN